MHDHDTDKESSVTRVLQPLALSKALQIHDNQANQLIMQVGVLRGHITLMMAQKLTNPLLSITVGDKHVLIIPFLPDSEQGERKKAILSHYDKVCKEAS